MSIKVRFAPSPTGRLHVGNVRTALMNWLFVRNQSQGQFILRIDDTDTERSTPAYEEAIKTDLDWLGLEWDATFKQSDKFEAYAQAAQKLKEAGLLYPCYELENELERQRKLQRIQAKPPVYNRAALALSESEKAKLEAQGHIPHWRFKLSGQPVCWIDIVRGNQKIDTSSISDPVLIRADGTYLYTLPSVVDDIDEGITHIVRGEDHVTNSGAQIEIFQALGAQAPQFAHTPLLVGEDGKNLSKRWNDLSIDSLRQEGFEAMAINTLLAKIGTSDSIEPRETLAQLQAEFSFSKIGRAPARFSPQELAWLNARLLHMLPYQTVKSSFDKWGLDSSEAFWLLLRGNINKLNDIHLWHNIIYGPYVGMISEADTQFCRMAADTLSQSITAHTWKTWTEKLKISSKRKGKSLYMPLRLALSGHEQGPDMAGLLQLIGVEKAKARLYGKCV